MLKGGVIMDVVNADQARIAEKAGVLFCLLLLIADRDNDLMTCPS